LRPNYLTLVLLLLEVVSLLSPWSLPCFFGLCQNATKVMNKELYYSMYSESNPIIDDYLNTVWIWPLYFSRLLAIAARHCKFKHSLHLFHAFSSTQCTELVSLKAAVCFRNRVLYYKQ